MLGLLMTQNFYSHFHQIIRFWIQAGFFLDQTKGIISFNPARRKILKEQFKEQCDSWGFNICNVCCDF